MRRLKSKQMSMVSLAATPIEQHSLDFFFGSLHLRQPFVIFVHFALFFSLLYLRVGLFSFARARTHLLAYVVGCA